MTTPKLITTAIPYMNGAPHMGHAFEVILTDVIARGLRLQGDPVFFLTGADEHGSKIWKTAEAAGRDVMDLLDENIGHFTAMNTTLGISNDGYIRTTDRDRHWPIVQALWMRLVEKGDIYKKNYAGWYCDREERFVTEEELETAADAPLIKGGKGGFGETENSSRNLKESGAPCRWSEDENYFFRLSKYSDVIKEKIASDEVKIIPEFRKNEMLAMIGEGLEDVSFSRTKKQLSWGIPVPNDPDHVMYVWCDALTNYISGAPLGRGDEEGVNLTPRVGRGVAMGSVYEKGANLIQNNSAGGLSDEDINNLFASWSCECHVIGKDIARFHCLTWIGMLLSAGVNLPKYILVHGFVNDKDGNKMSKSVGNVIDPQTVIDTYGADTLRLYMTGEVGVGQDLNFSDERIKTIHNDVLANNYGNLVNRVLSLWIAFREGQNTKDIIQNVGDAKPDVSKIIEHYSQSLNAFDTQAMFGAIQTLLNEANVMLNTTEPWKKTGEEKGKILIEGIIYVYYATLLLSPFIPHTTAKVMEAMKIAPGTTLKDPISCDLTSLTKPEILFAKL